MPSAVNDRRHRLETFQNIKASRRVGEPFPARERVALGPYWKVHAHLSARAQLEQPEISTKMGMINTVLCHHQLPCGVPKELALEDSEGLRHRVEEERANSLHLKVHDDHHEDAHAVRPKLLL